ncbi:a5565455-822b-4b0f-a687-8fc7c20c702a, partial [Sclerotinia trifoliorum]
MSQYSYSLHSLDSDSIRLLGLMPNKDQAAPIQCRLYSYPLQELDKGIHLYEALSYVWGSSDKPKFVFINEHSLPITANLHTALLHLRDRTFERIIWVDSICINQEDNTEKSRQIQLMAKIFGQANRVIVYLGEAADDSDQALEGIRVAAESDSPNIIVNEMDRRLILELLKRPWFQRIWVLQEVGLARQILIMCGSAMVDGYAFSLGFSRIFYEDDSDLPNLIRPVIYLIRGATFRPKHSVSPSGALSLGELIDMYHNHMATKRHDKIYALLSMSSDNLNPTGLSPDYTVPWAITLKRLVKSVLFKEVSVKTWEDKEIAVIESKGYVLGHVSSIAIDVASARYDKQHINIVFNNQPRSLQYEKEYGTRWALQASAKSIRQGDLVCLLHEASKPAIIRTYKDHFAIIVIAITLQQHVPRESEYVESLQPLPSMQKFPRDFLLIWNWGKSLENLQGQVGYEDTMEINTLVPEYLKTDTNKAVRSINIALTLGNIKNYKNAENIVRKGIKNYKGVLGKKNLYILALKESLAWIYGNQNEWTKADDLFSQVIQIRKDLQGNYHQDTLSSMANLLIVYMEEHHLGEGMKDMMIRLANRIENDIQMSEEDVIRVGRSFNQKMMKLLLDQKMENVLVTEKVVKAAVGNCYSGKEIMMLLLEKREAEMVITEEVVKAAAENQYSGKEIMMLLLEKRGAEGITEEVVAVAENWYSGKEIMM